MNTITNACLHPEEMAKLAEKIANIGYEIGISERKFAVSDIAVKTICNIGYRGLLVKTRDENPDDFEVFLGTSAEYFLTVMYLRRGGVELFSVCPQELFIKLKPILEKFLIEKAQESQKAKINETLSKFGDETKSENPLFPNQLFLK